MSLFVEYRRKVSFQFYILFARSFNLRDQSQMSDKKTPKILATVKVFFISKMKVKCETVKSVKY